MIFKIQPLELRLDLSMKYKLHTHTNITNVRYKKDKTGHIFHYNILDYNLTIFMISLRKNSEIWSVIIEGAKRIFFIFFIILICWDNNNIFLICSKSIISNWDSLSLVVFFGFYSFSHMFSFFNESILEILRDKSELYQSTLYVHHFFFFLKKRNK